VEEGEDLGFGDVGGDGSCGEGVGGGVEDWIRMLVAADSGCVNWGAYMTCLELD
jgi:hypothetical protein